MLTTKKKIRAAAKQAKDCAYKASTRGMGCHCPLCCCPTKRRRRNWAHRPLIHPCAPSVLKPPTRQGHPNREQGGNWGREWPAWSLTLPHPPPCQCSPQQHRDAHCQLSWIPSANSSPYIASPPHSRHKNGDGVSAQRPGPASPPPFWVLESEQNNLGN